MNKEMLIDGLATTGKIAVRVAANVGTNVATFGGGILGTMLVAGSFKNKVAQSVLLFVGSFGSVLAGYVLADKVDDKLVEMGFDVDGV